MRPGKSGVISSLNYKKRKSQYQVQDEDLENRQLNSSGVLHLYNVPVAVWSAGVFTILCGLFLLYHMIWGFEGKIFNDNFDGNSWWQYFVVLIILCLGFSFVLAANMEQVTLNKTHDTFIFVKKNIFCIHNSYQRALNQVTNLSIIKRGRDSIQNKTLHFLIIVNFDDGTFLEMMESNSLTKVKRKFLSFKRFIGQPINAENIHIIDESTK